MKCFNNVMVMGAGAVGGYFGGQLAQKTSTEVLFIARGQHLEALKTRGLQIKSINGDAQIQVHAQESIPENYQPDLILFTVKSFDTDEAIDKIKPAVSGETNILTLQNGIENYPKLAKAFGQRAIQGFCKIGASVPEPGVIEHSAFGKITAGEKEGKVSDRLKSMKALFDEAGIPFHISSEIDRRVWLKFTWNCIFNMITAAAGVTVDKLFEYDHTEALCYEIFDEIQRVAEAEGVRLTQADAESIIEPARDLTGFETSTYQDRMKGKRMEYEAFTGAIVRLGQKYDVAVPYNKTLYALLSLIDNKQ